MDNDSSMSAESLFSNPAYVDTPTSLEDEAQAVLRILAQIVDILKPRSLVEVGPGHGHWCRAAAVLGLEGVSGFEGTCEPCSSAAVDGSKLPGERLVFTRRFDLVVALGLALDISPEERKALIGHLCHAGDMVLFSSPDPLGSMAGGQTHWPEYWAAAFREKNYRCFDIFGRQPSLREEPDRLKRYAFLYARYGSEAANRLAPWSADGLILSSYPPEAVLTLMAKTEVIAADQIEAHDRYYREDLKSVERAPASGFLAPDASAAQSDERGRIRADAMAPIERRAGMIIGQRIGYDLGFGKALQIERTARMVEDQAQHAQDIAELEDELNRLSAIVNGLNASPILRALSAKIRQAGGPATAEQFKRARLERQHQRQIDIIRASNQFDSDWYLDCNPDIKERGLDPIRHYVEFGANEEREPTPSFDAKAYIHAHPYITALNDLPFVHYIRGLALNREHGD